MMNNEPFTFEDKIPVINNLLLRNRSHWQLSSLSWLDYDDVSQIIRIHIYKKFHLWDQAKAFEPWCNVVIRHQIRNLVRNHYGNFVRPCLKCPHNLGGNSCSLTASSLQTSECEDYEKWELKKKSAHDINLAVTEEKVAQQIKEIPFQHLDYDVAAANLHEEVLTHLNHRHGEIYRMLYIEGKSDDDVATLLNFKGDSDLSRKTARYKQLQNLKKKFFEIAQKILKGKNL